MKSYTQQLEQQNEELKELLAKEQEKVLKMEVMEKLVVPKWEKMHIPVLVGTTDLRECCVYQYGSLFIAYATVRWDEKRLRYYAEWHAQQVSPTDKLFFKSLEDAKNNVELHIKVRFEQLGYYE